MVINLLPVFLERRTEVNFGDLAVLEQNTFRSKLSHYKKKHQHDEGNIQYWFFR